MLKPSAKSLSVITTAALCAKVFATGFWEPTSWLENGGQIAVLAPEFFWEIECKRIAKEFVPAEKLVRAPESDDSEADRTEGLNRHQFTAKMDIEDFAAALKSGHLKAADAAIKAHAEARAILDKIERKPEPVAPDPAAKPAPAAAQPAAVTLPAEADSEFADYHKGAFAFRNADHANAKSAWEGLLKRPAGERLYRSTWAAYMLGKLALETDRYEDAIKFFQMTRQLAKEDFADSLGLAADSYGWEANAELAARHSDKAARLYLTQLAMGDGSAIGSLKSVIPLLPSTPSPDEPKPTDPALLAAAAEEAKVNQAAVDAAVKDPILRRLITASILSNIEKRWPGDESKPDTDAQTRWLALMEKLGGQDNTDAENLGWVAYTAGKYADAARWLKLSSGKTPAAQWLKAKLALRNGKLADATTALSEAVRGLQEKEELENTLIDGPIELPYKATRGDLGMVLLSRGDFVQALDTFLQGGLWEDAAYVAERCLTKKELCDYTDKHFSPEMLTELRAKKGGVTPEEDRINVQGHKFRALVARRLVREDDYKKARTYFEDKWWPALDDYTATLAKANNEKAPKKERARALFHAAWIARYQGLELMGTEVGPDNASFGGDMPWPDTAMERLTGKPHAVEDRDKEDDTRKTISLALPVSAEEKKRLAATKLNPELRFHYRHVAAGLAWKAASLLPDGAEETADVLNSAGSWIKTKHEKQADRFYQAIERRCSKTEIGKEAVKKHWFVEEGGSWSNEEQAIDTEREAAAAKKADEEFKKSEAEREKARQ